MEMYHRFMEWVKNLNNTDWGQLVSFIGMLAGIFSVMKWSSVFIVKYDRAIKSYGLIAFILLLGLILPVITLLSTNWVGWKHILLNLLAIYGVFNFLVLGFIIHKMTTAGNRSSVLRINPTEEFLQSEQIINMSVEKKSAPDPHL